MIEGGGIGGQVAAPAAKPVLEAALEAQKRQVGSRRREATLRKRAEPAAR